nr:segregation/condensation protein A [Roseomonas acroporae]
MVRRHQLDLGRLSIVTLTDQFTAALEAGADRVRLERRGDWLVMASELVRLKAQLLCPTNPREAAEAAAEADRRLGQLGELAAMRAAAAWLAARPQLGFDVFGRGQPPRRVQPQAELVLSFLEATLVLLEGRAGQGGGAGAATATYRPSPPELWRVPDALGRIAALLQEAPAAGLPLEACLPPLEPDAPDRPLRRRAALASTLVAGLELAREGTATIEQEEPFGSISIGLPATVGHG